MHRLRLMLISQVWKVRAPIERVQRLEDLEEDVLRQILGFVVAGRRTCRRG